MLGTPVVVVFFRMPVVNPASDTPLIFPTTVAPCVPVTSPTRLPVKLPALPVVFEEIVPAKFRVTPPLEPPPVKPVPAVTLVIVPVVGAVQAHTVPDHARTLLVEHVVSKVRARLPDDPPPERPLPAAVVAPVMVP